ncbi:MAG: hypothetical protein QXI12_12980 [Candidatus Methanomethyliaceae archaeon]
MSDSLAESGILRDDAEREPAIVQVHSWAFQSLYRTQVSLLGKWLLTKGTYLVVLYHLFLSDFGNRKILQGT